jgi:hypothetical protein
MILPVKAPRPLPASADHDTDEPTAAVEAMIAELGRLRQRTGDRALLGATRPRSTGRKPSPTGSSWTSGPGPSACPLAR